MIEESSPLVSALNCLTLIPLLSGGQNNHLLLKKCFIASIIKFSKYKNKERENIKCYHWLWLSNVEGTLAMMIAGKKIRGLPIMEISKHAIKMENSNLSFNKKKHEAILAGTHYQILAILWRWNESHWLIFKTLNSLRDANLEAFLVRNNPGMS